MLQILWILFLVAPTLGLASVPTPTDTSHPGNESSVLGFERVEIKELGRTSPLYLPKRPAGESSPLVVFGHGQALNEGHYDKTLEHLAKKGVAVLFAQFDDGFFDQDWRRMASDWNKITLAAIDQYSDRITEDQIIYSGHSKGGYIGLMAAGAPDHPKVAAGIYFAPAGFDQQYLKDLDSEFVLTLVWGEKDSVIKKNDVMDIYDQSLVGNKQYIEVKSYSDGEADHYFPQNKSTFFGGKNGVTAFHHHGVWQWLVAAAWDLEAGGNVTQPYVYGDKTGLSGEPGLTHTVTRSWDVRYEYLFKLKNENSQFGTLGSFRNTITSIGHSWWKSIYSKQQVQTIKRSGEAKFIGRNIELKMLAEPNDLHPKQWALKNPKGFDISATQAWDFSVGNEDIVVAVIDSGIQISNSDLKDNIWVNQAEEKGEKGVDDDGNGYIDDIKGFHFLLNKPDSSDTRGHGTMVSGVIGATGNNGRNITGVAWNVKLMSLNMFPNLWGNATLEAAIQAIDYAIENGADVINASFGQADDDLEPDEGFKAFTEVMQRVHDAGIPFVAAAGNSAGDNDKTGMIPATLDFDNIIAVGAMNASGYNWLSSNFGKNSVEVMAPGVGIYTTHISGMKSPNGTSLSAPIVSGIVVLMLDQNPDLKPKEIRDILARSCDAFAPLADFSRCGGYVNAERAVKAAIQLKKAN